MASIIIYATDASYLDKTIDSIIDNTSSVDEIIVCDDVGLSIVRPDVKVIMTEKVGRAKAWNFAAAQASSDVLVFMKCRTKCSPNWLQPILDHLRLYKQSLVSPIVHTLDLSMWASEPNRWRRFGWRWDLNFFDKPPVGSHESPAISSYCIAVNKSWFCVLGQFDEGMGLGAGEDLELSLKTWLFGGDAVVCDASSISVGFEYSDHEKTLTNFARIAETWFPNRASRFYNARGVNRSSINVGRINRSSDQKIRNIDWFIKKLQPELDGIHELHGSAFGKTIAVVGPGPSLDYVNLATINNADIVIGIDYVGLMLDCDYVMSDSVHVLAELRSKYRDDQFVLPTVLVDRTLSNATRSAEFMPDARLFELAASGQVNSINPPLCNFDNLVLTAVHFALFLNPQSVTVFGCDNKLVRGKSHTSKISYYGDGAIWPDGEGSRKRFAFYEYGLDQLGKLAASINIPLLRTCAA